MVALFVIYLLVKELLTLFQYVADLFFAVQGGVAQLAYLIESDFLRR